MEITLKFFAKAKDLTGTAETKFHVKQSNSLTVGSFLQQVHSKFPRLRELNNEVILAHNLEFVELNPTSPFNIRSGDEIAFLPPVSGG
ncbi:uncharacterized protein LOC129600173 [Paramacrobiotus metropolitanus]|uniref:uncharacterized protein LOC129600173 n=1 Tax=Paramacrobiotus metropolitanus TaxID=2943436 RepID=UPI0024463784|nr:uncharacterized protein LOC129600173 [Paramacrobiotus metropolitanus]